MSLRNLGTNAAALNNALVPKWQPNHAYALAEVVMAPDGSIVERTSAGTSGSTYTGTNWKTATGISNAITAGVTPAVDASIAANHLVADLVAAVGTKTLTRTNLYPYPSFEAGIPTGMTGNSCTLTNPTTDAWVGTKVIRATSTVTSGFTINGTTTTIPVTAGDVITISAYFRGVLGRTPYFRATWTGATATTGTASAAPAALNVWERRSQTFTAPTGATAVKFDILVSNSGSIGDWYEVDAVLVEKAATVGTYFDGDFTDTTTQEYTWTGATNLSSSQYFVWVPPAPTITDTALAAAVQSPLTKAQLDANYGRVTDLDHVLKTHTTRTNLSPNPSFETDLTGYTGNSCTLTNPTTDAAFGTKVMRATSTVTGGYTINGPGGIAVTPGESITYSFSIRGVPARIPKVRATWTGATADTGPSLGASSSQTAWERKSQTFTVPTGATAVRFDITNSNAAAIGDWYEIDAVLIEKTATAGTYFDGSTTNTTLLQHAWSGTAHLSASTQAVTTVPDLGASDAAIATKVALPLTKAVLDAAYVREAIATTPEVVLQQRFRRDKGVIGTGGKGVIALRYDHWLNYYGATVLPLLVARMIPSGVCLYSRMLTPGDTYVDTDSTNYTWADIQAWCLTKGVEVWSHSRSHADTPGLIPDTNPDGQLAAMVDEIVGSKAELETNMPRVKIQGWMQPGNTIRGGHTYTYADFNTRDHQSFYTTRAGRLLRRTYPVVETDMLGYMRPLPTGVFHGSGHCTTDGLSYASLKDIVDVTIARKAGVEFMTHAGLLDTTSQTTLADYTAWLDYIATKVDAGVLDVVTPSGLYMADPGRSDRIELVAGGDFEGFNATTNPGLWTNIPAGTTVGNDAGGRGAFLTIPSTGGLMRQDASYTAVWGCSGETFIVEAWARRTQPANAAASIRLTVADNTTWAQSYDTALSSGSSWQRVGAVFTVPTDVTFFRLDVGRLSGGAVDVTDVRVKKV